MQKPPDVNVITTYECRVYQANRREMRGGGYLELVLGLDRWGSGLTLYWHAANGGAWPSLETVLSARWAHKPIGLEDSLRLAARAIREAQTRRGFVPEDPPL